jgi:hypothetical protein
MAAEHADGLWQALVSGDVPARAARPQQPHGHAAAAAAAAAAAKG